MKKKGLRKIAACFPGVTKATLASLVKGGKSISEFNAAKRSLHAAEERVLINLLGESADRGFPLTHSQLKKSAEAILAKRPGSSEDKPHLLGHNWVARFLDHYSDEIHTYWPKALAMERAQALNPAAVSSWYDLVEEQVVKRGIKKHNIYGMDESGFPSTNDGKQRVIGRKGTKTQHKVGSGNRENVTAIVTICADGTALKPTVIFKGKNFLEKWGANNVSGASLGVSENGWTDGGLCLEWMKKDFDPSTRDKANGDTRVLVMDGHSSHYTAELLEYCRAANIEILGYPPHCTHALQGLDVVCFAKMKSEWKKAIDDFEALHHCSVGKESFCEVFGTAYLRAFTPDTVCAAFRVTGIVPFDREVIKAHQMKPSALTSTQASFPLVQTSPTCAVLNAWQSHTFTTQDIQPDSPPQAGPSHFPGALGTPPAPSTPDPHNQSFLSLDPRLFNIGTGPPRTPKRRRCEDEEETETPSKRMRMLGKSLASTESGSFLVSKAKVTHQQMKTVIRPPVLESVPSVLRHPDWSILAPHPSPSKMSRSALEERARKLESELALARDRSGIQESILEGQNAQMIVQNIGMIRMNQSLHEKENKKASDRQVLFPGGKGRHLTNVEVIALKKDMEQKAADAVVAKSSREGVRQAKRLEREVIEARWSRIREEHTATVSAWESQCKLLREEGKRGKDLPKKPKRQPKPKESLPEVDDGEDDDED